MTHTNKRYLSIVDLLVDSVNSCHADPVLRFKIDLRNALVEMKVSHYDANRLVCPMDLRVDQDFIQSEVYNECVQKFADCILTIFCNVSREFGSENAVREIGKMYIHLTD